jgi:DNA-binding protein H-NS
MIASPRSLEALDYHELEKIERQIQELKAKRYDQATAGYNQKTQKQRAALEAMARDMGFALNLAAPTTLQAVTRPATSPVKAKIKKAKSKPGKVLYRDPANPKNQWTGRGPEPKWLAVQTKAGRPRSDFAVA